MKSESKRDGEDFIKAEFTEFKVLDKVDAKTFDEPLMIAVLNLVMFSIFGIE